MVECPVCEKGKIVVERTKEVVEVSEMVHESQDSPRVLEMDLYDRQETTDILDERVICENCKTKFEHEVDGGSDYWVSADLEKVVLK